MIERLSKCVFWIPEKISDRYRKKSTKKSEIKKCSRKSRKNIFRDQKNIGEIIFEKVNEKWKFRNLDFFKKKIEISKFSFYIDFFIRFFRKIFGLKKYFSELFRKIFFISRKNIYFLEYFFIMSNFPRNPKIILRKPYEHYKIV